MSTLKTKHISASVNCSAEKAYEFVYDPNNLPSWAAGLSEGIEKVGDDWIAHSPMGKVIVKFTEKNTMGVLDHYVIIPEGPTFLNPMRVIPNNIGCEVVFTLFKHKGMTNEEFSRDTGMIEKDLKKLKELLEE